MGRHSTLTASRKLHIFDAAVVSKLRYCTASAWLSKGCLRKLDGFHCSCLRKILGIKASYISRVSNDRVRARAERRKLSWEIRRSQLALLGKVLFDTDKAILKEVTFCADSLTPLTNAWVRRVGRPRDEWTNQLLKISQRLAGSMEAWYLAATCQKLWKELVVDKVCI